MPVADVSPQDMPTRWTVRRHQLARDGADGHPDDGKNPSPRLSLLRIVPIRRHAAAPSLGHRGRVLVFNRHATFPLRRASKVRTVPFVVAHANLTAILTRRNAMSMTTAATPSAANDPRLHRAGPLGGTPNLGEKTTRVRMVRLTVNLPSHLVEHMRDAVYWTPGLTLAWLVARAVRASLTELEAVHQGPFPKRAKPLRAGRPRLLGQSMKVQTPAGTLKTPEVRLST